ncbi:hypothetical protein [Xanthobacter flavus]|uniref:hypothetical protein n=1 Tax=Xanthobacter flavus TaxID=281 RepID=UPI003726EB15
MQRIRDAQTILGTLEDGELAKELSFQITDSLRQLKEQCGNRPKVKAKGKVTLTINLEVQDGSVTIDCEVAAKVPKPPRASTFLWVLEDGSLSTEHPKQMDMFAGPKPVGGTAINA